MKYSKKSAKIKRIISHVLLFTVSFASFITAGFAWFSFDKSVPTTPFVVSAGTMKVPSYSFTYYAYDNDNQILKVATENYTSENGLTFAQGSGSVAASVVSQDVSEASVSGITSFAMDYFDPYYAEIFGTDKANTDLIVRFTFALQNNCDATYSLKVLPFDLTGIYSVFTNYQATTLNAQ